jgi:short-subunit dehydrogenase
MNVKGKVAIVTGASSGIGIATARLLSSKGVKVALVARNKAKLEALQKEIPKSLVVVCDLRRENEIRKMIETVTMHFGRIDILINNAGRGYDSFVENIDTKKFEELFALLLRGPLVAMQDTIPVMIRNGGGVIVNISSGTSLMAVPTLGAYSSLKRALNGLSLTASQELKKDKIQVSIVYPYITDTNFYKNVMGHPRKTVEIRGKDIPPPDSAEFVAEKILEAIESGKEEIYAHDWMGK